MGMPNVLPEEGAAAGANGAGAGTAPKADALSPEQQKIQQLENELKTVSDEKEKARGYAIALTQRLSEMMENSQQSVRRAEPDMSPEDRRAALKRAIEEDPEETLDAHFQQRMAPLMQKNNTTLAALNKDRFVQSIGQDKWAKYEGEVHNLVKGLDPATMAEPGAWEQAYRMVLAGHIDEIIEERMREKAEASQRQAELEGSSSHAAASRADRGLSSLEKMMAAEFGMNEQEWRSYGNKNLHQAIPEGEGE